MPPRTLLVRPQCMRVVQLPVRQIQHPLLRNYTAPASSGSGNQPATPAQDGLPGVSEEAAATAKITGETSPEIDQGTPISEVINRNPEAQKKAPSVLKKDIPGSKREYSTIAPNPRDDNIVDAVDINAAVPPANLAEDVVVDDVSVPGGLVQGAKFPLPSLPLPAQEANIHYRYSPILEQVTNLLMRDGKKATAQSVMTNVIAILRTKGAPKHNPRTPIIPTSPPFESLPSDPIAYLQTAVDSLAPLMRITQQKGSGGFRDPVPAPLALRQRRRRAIMWMIDAADKKKARMNLAERFADEIIAVVEGRSSAWEKRQAVHKTAVAARANLKVKV
ncbi:ribosomal protein S7 domain-containing protein [Pyronema domesticum]|uniref:Small ribosomal subunit protein uS7m n=1 Tax=Pyronema omphalodes (strain CBS 100304) TaxID=1076935 RepID=U4KWD0_PYROM|nr:ribosomal protein S7 domain-containing protein [Pyronema domesticum]CCX06157.1 Similar to 37S ribosomal protein S7, mitochondrial; acc. no. P47150 [Pyronema omphalodes CBS 100304]